MAAGAGKEDFKLTTDEAHRLKEALKKEEFRKLLLEYAEEISDPENKKKYEDDITQLEKERGMDVKFVKLKPRFVLKTTILPTRKKLFINVGICDLVGTPIATPGRLPNGKTGRQWSIPYTITKPRDDMDNGRKCSIIDVGFHTVTMEQGDKDRRFFDLIANTVIDGVQSDLGLSIDKKRVKRMKFDYKGTPHPSLIRKKKDTPTSNSTPDTNDSGGVLDDDDPLKFPYPPLDNETNEPAATPKKPKSPNKTKLPNKPPPHEPVYTIVHRGEFDMQDYTFSTISTSIKRPKELVVTVKLPKLDSTKTVELDIFEKRLVLMNEKPHYHLELNLSYPVDEGRTQAKFDKSSKILTITLPVLPPPTPSKPHPFNGDSVPLIEPLENDDDISLSHEKDEESDVTIATEPYPVVNPSVKSDWSVNETWECPPFSYRQNKDCISFVLHVTKVKVNTLTSHFDHNSGHVTFIGSEPEQSDSKSYSFYVLFNELDGCGPVIKPDNCRLDVGDSNTVVVLGKEDNCTELQTFRVGPNPRHLTEKHFLTADNVSTAIHRLAEEDPWKDTENGIPDSASVSVHHKDEQKCVLKVDENETTSTISVAMENTDNIEKNADESLTPPTNYSSLNGSQPNEQSSTKPTQNIITKSQLPPQSNGHASATPPPLINEPTKPIVKFSNELLYDLD